MKKSQVALLCITFFLAGIVSGFMTSPIKKGISIGNNSGNNSGNDNVCTNERKPFGKHKVAKTCCKPDDEL